MRLRTARSGRVRNDETGALADGERSRPGEQVERHRDGHRRGDADGKEMQYQAVGTPIPMIDAQGDDDRHAPAQHAGQQGCHPSAAYAQQAQRDDGDDDGGHGAANDSQGDAGQRRRDQLMAAQEGRTKGDRHGEPVQGSASAPHNERSERRFTSRTRSARGWNPSAGVEHDDRRRIGVAAELRTDTSRIRHRSRTCEPLAGPAAAEKVARSGASPARRWPPPTRR